MEIFNFKFLFKTDQKIVFCVGYEGKKGFLDHKNMGSKHHPNLHFFSKWLVHGFFSKK